MLWKISWFDSLVEQELKLYLYSWLFVNTPLDNVVMLSGETTSGELDTRVRCVKRKQNLLKELQRLLFFFFFFLFFIAWNSFNFQIFSNPFFFLLFCLSILLMLWLDEKPVNLGFLWYYWTRRLQQITSSFLSSNWCFL